MDGAGICILCKEEGEDYTHVLLTCPYAILMGTKCASLFEIQAHMAESSSIWERLQVTQGYRGFAMIVIAAICWNSRKERNDRLFSDIFHIVNGCIARIYMDVSLWAGWLSDRERVCISNDDSYHQDDGPLQDGEGMATTILDICPTIAREGRRSHSLVFC